MNEEMDGIDDPAKSRMVFVPADSSINSLTM
jgi:hypothetical protein